MLQVMISKLYPTHQTYLIGQGSQGSVHKFTKGTQTSAIKVYQKDIDQDEKQFLDLLINKSIKSPMMKIYKHYQTIQNKYQIEQQYFEGGSLEKKLYNLQRKDIVQIIQQIGKQLEFIHNNGYVYQDLKPSNIVSGSDPESPNDKLYKICDFGTIRKVDKTEKVQNPERRDGTVNYFPFDEYTDYPLDIFSFGVLIYELLCKQLLFHGTNLNEITTAKRQFYQSQTQIFEKIDQLKDTNIEFDNMLKKMLDPNPNNRPKIQQVNQFFQSNSIYFDNCKKQQLEYLKLKDQVNILTQANFDLQETIKKLIEKQQKDQENFLQLNDEYVCNIQLAEKIEILNQKLYRSSGRKFRLNGNTGMVLLEQQIELFIKEFVNKGKEDSQQIKDLNYLNLNLNEKLKIKEDQLIIKEDQLMKLNEQFKIKDEQLIIVQKQLTESMREKYAPQKQMVRVLGSYNQNIINNSRSQKCFPPKLIQNKEVRLYK